MFKTFYIHLPEDSKEKSVPALILHALDAIKEDSQDKRISLTHFNLVSPYTKLDSYSIYYQYSFMTKAELKQRQELIDEFDHKVSDVATSLSQLDVKAQSFKGEDGTLQAVTLKLAKGEEQDDDLRLVGQLAQSISDIGRSQTVLDIVYHDYCDEDGLRHPFFTYYLMK